MKKLILFGLCLFALVSEAQVATRKSTMAELQLGSVVNAYIGPDQALFLFGGGVYGTNDLYANSFRLLATNYYGLPVGLRVYNPNTNSVTLEQLSLVSPTDSNQVVTVGMDRIAFSPGLSLTNLYTGAGWGAAGLVSKAFTNVNLGNGMGIGAVLKSVVNAVNYFSNQPNGYWKAVGGAAAWTNSVRGELYTGLTNHWGDVAAGGALPGTTWGPTNQLWISATNGSIWAFKSDGMTIWATNFFALPW